MAPPDPDDLTDAADGAGLPIMADILRIAADRGAPLPDPLTPLTVAVLYATHIGPAIDSLTAALRDQP